ncbi:MAG TPA: hypothetical protein VE398_26090 [Acidobacteriota bacterium]|nr:hypothetical protein [Acidobacteriota bacterium]
MIVLFLLSARYALTLRLHYRDLLSRIDQVHQLPADPPEGGYSAAPKPIRRRPMAEAFRSGHLPDPLPIPAGDPDQIAADLAKKIGARDEQSTAALLTALQMAGFGIRAPGGQLVVKPADASQGMAFDTFSVSAMAKLYNDGWQISLADLSLILGKTVPAFQKVPLSDVLSDGIVKASQGEQPLRFWARLIVEMGKQSSPSYDLSSGKFDPAIVQLDSIQTSLIVERLYGDMVSRRKPAAAPTVHSSAHRDTDRPAYFQPAVFHPTPAFRLLRTAALEGGADSPCDLGEIGDNIMDLNAIIKTTEWEKLLDFEKQEGIGGPVGGANAVLAFLRVIWVYANMYVEVTMDPPKPPDAPVRADNNNVLIRTDNTEPGETRTLTAKVWFDIDKSALTNCLRPLLHREKLDFGSLPNGGAAKGVGVAWRLTEGGFPLPGTYHNDPAGLLEARKNALVYFDNGGGAEGSTWNKETDKYGKTSIKVTGNPQPRNLTNTKRKPVLKEFAVAVDVKYKNASEADKMLGELLDVVGPGLGISSGDLLGGVSGAIAETIFRMHWNIDGVFPFPVEDWVANGAWTGTIRYTHIYAPSFPPNIVNNNRTKSISTSTWRVDTESVVTLDGSLADDGYSQTALLSGHSIQTHTSQSHAESIDDCHRASNIVTYTLDSHSESSEELTGKSSYRAIAMVSIFTSPDGSMHYRVSIGLAPGEDFTNNGTHKQQSVTTRSGCGESKTDTYSPSPQTITIGLPTPEAEGDLDPKHPDIINGHQESSGRDGEKVVIVWNLVRH